MCRDRLLSPARSRPARHASEGCYGSRRWHEAGHGPRRSLQRRSRSACPRLARKHRDRNPQRDSSVTIYPLVSAPPATPPIPAPIMAPTGPPTSAPAIPPVIAPAAAPFSSASAGLETDNSVQRKANRISAIDMATLLHFV